jgi:CBS domain-containing protein
MEAWQHKLIDSLKIVIGLFCFGTFSLNPMLDHLAKKYNVKPSEIRQMRLSKEFVVQTDKETIRIPMEEIAEHMLPSCRTCMDFTSELADISVGSAYPLPDWSTVIIRTKAGEDFFYEAVKEGVLNTWVIEQEPRVFERVAKAALEKRNNALVEASKMEEAYGYLPVRMLRETEELALFKAEQIMTKDVRAVKNKMTVSQLLDMMAKERHMAYPVVDDSGTPVGFVTLEEVSAIAKDKRENTQVGSIARKTLVTVEPEETALEIFRKMSANETGRVLVVRAKEPKKILGIVTKTDLMHALISHA